LFSPKGLDVRPTRGRVKEALFSMLSPFMDGAVFLDLYAGTGAIGIEALSRGAAYVVFVDNSRRSLEYINRNIEHCKLSANARIIRADACAFLKQNNMPFDIIFLDPPYDNDWPHNTLNLIQKHGALKPGGLCAIECSANGILSPEGFDIFKNKRYNNTNIIIYRIIKGDSL